MRNRARHGNNLITVALIDAGAIHSRIDVEKNPHSAGVPLLHLPVALG